MDHDPEIQALIRQWAPPIPPPGIDVRMMARFHARRRPLWRRRIELRVAIPAPALGAALLLLFAAGAWWGFEAQARSSFRERMGGFEAVSAPQLSVTASAEPQGAGQ
jgi:hypothetical protein